MSIRDAVTRDYLSGVQAVQDAVAAFGPDEWSGVACGDWDAADTVRHLVGVVGWYQEWLVRALDGKSDIPFPAADFKARNAAALEGLQHLDGPTAIAEFETRAHDYLERAVGHWDLAFGYPAGTVTVGLHLGVAAAEWNLHAWDIYGDRGYEPDNPASLFVGAGACVAMAKGGFGGKLLGLVIPLAAKRSPWQTMLKESGRRR